MEENTVSKNGLVGNHTHTLDSKNRVFFPAKFREELGAPIVITISTDRCLAAYSEAEWENFVAKIESYPKAKVKTIKRIFCGNAVKVNPDSQGRVMIDKNLLEFAGITGMITFCGCGDMVEIWDKDKAPITVLDDKTLAEIDETMLELDI